jgi:hypothetical protein
VRRILVVADRRVAVQHLQGAVERGLLDDADVFVLYAAGSPGAPRLLGRRRFWRTRHAELDALLTGLTAAGVLSDGIAVLDPVEALRSVLETSPPGELLLFRTPGLQRRADAIERLVEAASTSRAVPLPTIWLDI